MKSDLYSALKYEKGKRNGTPGQFLNIGDMVQSLAAIQHLPRVDYYVERGVQTISQSSLPQSFCIKNGFYVDGMLPPSHNNVESFYISVHINKPEIITQDVIDHFKENGPIGCRDASTYYLLLENGIDAYYSGCLTFSFPASKLQRTDQVYLVNLDADGLDMVPQELKKNAVSINYGTARSLKDLLLKDRGKILRPLPGVYESFKELFEFPRIFLNEEYRSLLPETWTENDLANLLHLFKAKALLDIYSRAKLVITSRLHCAAPCIALGTPVIFIPRKIHASGIPRFETIGRYIPLNLNSSSKQIDWNPKVVDIEPHRKFLRLICQKAVETQTNPLKELDLTYFQQQSGWHVDIP